MLCVSCCCFMGPPPATDAVVAGENLLAEVEAALVDVGVSDVAPIPVREDSRDSHDGGGRGGILTKTREGRKKDSL